MWNIYSQGVSDYSRRFLDLLDLEVLGISEERWSIELISGILNAILTGFESPTSQMTTTLPPNEKTVDTSGLESTEKRGP